MIEAINLTKIYSEKKKIKAADNISFQVNQGEIIALLGVNGAGKTTTMRMLSTVLKPTSGDAILNNFSIKNEPEKVRKSIGFLSGDTGLYNRLTGREILNYFGKLYDMKQEEINSSIEKYTELLDMKEFIDKKIDSLSTGMRQKVSIARSIIHDPTIMIFDEPTSGLDILTSHNIISFIKKCKTDNKAVLFSTHIMREAERIADRIIMIHKGKILAEGSLEDLQNLTSEKDLDHIFIHLVNAQNNSKEFYNELE